MALQESCTIYFIIIVDNSRSFCGLEMLAYEYKEYHYIVYLWHQIDTYETVTDSEYYNQFKKRYKEYQTVKISTYSHK